MRQTIICPHCRSKKAMYSKGSAEVSDEAGHLFFVCENCNEPTVLSVEAVNPKRNLERFFYFAHHGSQIEKSGWRIPNIWPKHHYVESPLPVGVPRHIQAHFQHSQKAAANGGYDLAIQGFQRVLVLARSAVSPEFKGSLTAWIISLIDEGQLLQSVRGWLSRVTIQKEVDGADALQAEDLATFTFVVLDQLFGVSSRINTYRARGAV